MKTERGAASILIELGDGKITMRHGTDKDVLNAAAEVREGTWKLLFDTIKKVIADNDITLPPAVEKIAWKRIDNDTNGNPRYVCHWLNFTKGTGSETYETALSRARKIGGRKFHNKQYGGGIVFQSYNIEDTERSIHELMAKY